MKLRIMGLLAALFVARRLGGVHVERGPLRW